MSRDQTPNSAYPKGMAGILEHMNARRAPLTFAKGEALPRLNCNLEALAREVVPPPGPKPKNPSGHARKSWEIAKELSGQNALLHLNGLLIAHLRKQSQPKHTADLFVRLWTEQADLLLEHMDLRWKVSSLTTFGDHGQTPVQRSTGLALGTLFGTIKLYESERLFSGRDADRPFTLDGRANSPLPLGMDAFALTDGGLDVNLIGRLWEESASDDVIRPLAQDMLQRLIDDPRTVFRRLHRLRVRKLRRQKQAKEENTVKANPLPVPRAVVTNTASPPSWGLVCTTNAPVLEVARFVAHHLDMGCDRIDLYLDTPNPDVSLLLEANPKVHLTVCDHDYWQTEKGARPDPHQLRQSFNATRALRLAKSHVDWLGHIDVDEFVLSDRRFNTQLAKVPDDMAATRMYPAEALSSPTKGYMPTHFKLRANGPGSSSALRDAYPTFGSYLRRGFLSHIAGKVFVRTGISDVRFRIHRIKFQGQDVTNIHEMSDCFIGHVHAPDWETFMAKLKFRKSDGSYRVRPDEPEKSVGRLIHWLEKEEGADGLRLFFEEMCLDSSDLRTRLRRNNLLLEPKFDPDAAIERVFGLRLAG